MIDYKSIGTRIRAVRQEKKLTQEQLAEAVGVGVTHISHIETGNSVPSLLVMARDWQPMTMASEPLMPPSTSG